MYSKTVHYSNRIIGFYNKILPDDISLHARLAMHENTLLISQA